jgi:hypothetical protein
MNGFVVRAVAFSAMVASAHAAPVVGLGDDAIGVMGLHSSVSKTGAYLSTDVEGYGLGVGAQFGLLDQTRWGLDAVASVQFMNFSGEYQSRGHWASPVFYYEYTNHDYEYDTLGFTGGVVAFYKLSEDFKPFAGVNVIHRRMSGDVPSSNDTELGYVVGIEWKILEQWSMTPSLVDNGLDEDVVLSTRYQLSDRWAVDATVNLTSDDDLFGAGLTMGW